MSSADPGGAPPPSPRILSVEPLDQGGRRVRLALDDGARLEVPAEAFYGAGLRPGDPLDEAERASLLDADLAWRAREAALGLLAVRARTRRELGQRLRRKGFEARVVGSTLDELTERGLLDDAAFARSFVRDRLRLKPKSKGLLARELFEKGVDGPTGERALEDVFQTEEVSEVALATEAALGWLRRQGAEARRALALHERTPAREKARRRLHGFLARRGFGGEAALAGLAAAERQARDVPS